MLTALLIVLGVIMFFILVAVVAALGGIFFVLSNLDLILIGVIVCMIVNFIMKKFKK